MNEFTDRSLIEQILKPTLFLRQVLGQVFDNLDEGQKRQLLATPPKLLEKIYSKLQKLGISDEKIASSPLLLIRDPAIMQRNYNFLAKKGFSHQFIVNNAEILCLNPNTLQHPDFLRKLREMEKRKTPAPEGELRQTAHLVWKRSQEKIPVKPVKLRLVR
jgi:hypothetical protein